MATGGRTFAVRNPLDDSLVANVAAGGRAEAEAAVAAAHAAFPAWSAMGPTELAAMRRRTVGYVFQRLNLIPSLTAAENVMLPLELNGMSARAARAAARATLADTGIGQLCDRYPDDLSGGQQQRVAIARALVGDRKLLLADEPTGALDTVTGEEVLGLLAARATAGVAIMLVTHEPRFASFADRVVTLRDGRLVPQTRTVMEGVR